jgi:hypothetical protein
MAKKEHATQWPRKEHTTQWPKKEQTTQWLKGKRQKDKRANNDPQNITQKTRDRTT